MSKRLQKYHVQLKLLKEASAIMRKEILKNCNKYLLCCLCECAQNVLKGNVPVTEAQKTKLARFKKKLREFASKKLVARLGKTCANLRIQRRSAYSCVFPFGETTSNSALECNQT